MDCARGLNMIQSTKSVCPVFANLRSHIPGTPYRGHICFKAFLKNHNLARGQATIFDEYKLAFIQHRQAVHVFHPYTGTPPMDEDITQTKRRPDLSTTGLVAGFTWIFYYLFLLPKNAPRTWSFRPRYIASWLGPYQFMVRHSYSWSYPFVGFI